MATNSNSTQQFWDSFAQGYAKVEPINFQSGFTLFMMSRANMPGARVLEVGCGSGYGSGLVANGILSSQDSPVFVTSDFSSEMVNMTKQRLQQSDYSLIDGNKLVFDEKDYVSDPSQKVDLDAIVAGQGTFRKLVFGCQASGSALPFPDEWFTSYSSNLVLQLIDSPRDQIAEAYRVLKPGSVAAFTVWGRRENSLIFTTLEMTKKRMAEKRGETYSEKKTDVASNFDFGEAIDQNLQLFRDAGFAQVKHWFQAVNHVYRNSDEFFASPVTGSLRQLDPEMQQEARQTYEDMSGANTPDNRTMEVMVILAFKD